MKLDEADSSHDLPNAQAIPKTYRLLNARRIEMDQYIASFGGDAGSREEAWQTLEAMLVELRRLVRCLAKTAASDLPALRGKAEVLATLFRPDDPDGGLRIPEDKGSALAASLAHDVIQLPED